MKKKAMIILSMCVISLLAVPAIADVSVRTVDFLEPQELEINAAGPLLVQMDDGHNRLIVANTLSSSVSIIDCSDHSVLNIPLEGRALQHLKSEALTFSRRTGEVYLIGDRCFFVVSPREKTSRTITTDVQFESITVDETSGNVFLAGRESKSLGFWRPEADRLENVEWLQDHEDLINLNQTPPPPIRKVITDQKLGRVLAIDGFTSRLYQFDSRSGVLKSSREVGLTSGGRWHLAGYNEKGHFLFIVVETDERKVIEAAKIDVVGGKDVIVPLPGFTEGVGITYNPIRDEVYIPYDNHPSVHVIDFGENCSVSEIKIPAYGNDASVIDVQNDVLYVSSWAFGEIDVIDLKERRMIRRISDLGILPHMFTMAFDPNNNLIYFPRGATAVNGAFGTAVTVLDPETEETRKIYTGWAPVDLIEIAGRNSFLVFNSEDRFAEVHADGSFEFYTLPYDYPVQAIYSPDEDIYLSYGPHQTYWPVVYIWGAKNGILTINANDLSFYDRRIARQAHNIVLDRTGRLIFTQNNWGKEEQFLGTLEDEVRVSDPNKRIKLRDEVEREITQRILVYDPQMNQLYLVRVGERDDDPSILQVIDACDDSVVQRINLGRTATDLVFDRENLYVANFDSRTVSIIDKSDFTVKEIKAGNNPLKLCLIENSVLVLDHSDNTIRDIKGKGRTHRIPYKGRPDNIFVWKDQAVITSHTENKLMIVRFDHRSGSFSLLHSEDYPFGDTRFHSRNVSFYLRGQFGDAVFSITKGKTDSDGRLWITDFLSGKLFILEDTGHDR